VRVNAINPGLIEIDHFTRNVEGVRSNPVVSGEDAIRFQLSSRGTKDPFAMATVLRFDLVEMMALYCRRSWPAPMRDTSTNRLRLT
jgi:hypothetical protein